MIELNPTIATMIMLGAILLCIMIGLPVAVAIGTVAFIVGYVIFGNHIGQMLYIRVLGLLENYVLLAVPLFVFMGSMLERSGIAEKLYDALYIWLGGVRGGLAIITLLIGTIMACTVAIIAASITMLTITALPHMIRRGYEKGLATGVIAAGGTLGILIPPSIMLVVYGPMAQISVGKLFFAAFMPGFLLAALYITYVVISSAIYPRKGPAVPADERQSIPFSKKITVLISSLIPPVFLVLAVLGVIYFGIAPPTEASGAGAFAATLLAIAYRKFSWRVLKEVTLETLRTCGFVFFLAPMAFFFVGVFLGAGGGDVVAALILAAPGGSWGAFTVIMLMVFCLGFVMDWLGVVLIIVPIVTPIVPILGFDSLWFAMMICVNLQTSFMTPPFAWAIFIIKGVASPDLGITAADIIRGMLPFVALVLIGMLLCIAFPQIVLWLPSRMIA